MAFFSVPSQLGLVVRYSDFTALAKRAPECVARHIVQLRLAPPRVVIGRPIPRERLNEGELHALRKVRPASDQSDEGIDDTFISVQSCEVARAMRALYF
jgi:hypothetical protein